MNTEGSRLLAVAIVWQALKDYQKASEILAIAPDNTNAKAEQLEIEQFFESSWFQDLKEIALETIYDGILEDFKNDSKRIFETGFLNRPQDKGKRKTA